MTGLNQRIEWIDRLRRRFARGVTVIDFDGLVLRLASARLGPEGRPVLLAQTEAPADATPGEALVKAAAGYRDALRAAGLKAPRRAVLVTAQAVQGLVRLPVPPAKPRKPPQMHALLQTDAATLAALFAQSWSLEGVLQAQGVLDDDGRAALAAQRLREREQERQGGRAAWASAQELVERMGLASAAQVDEAQRLLASLQTLSGRNTVAWRALPGQDGGPPWNWLVTAMDAAQRDAWQAHCARAGLALAAVYPRGGLAALAWPDGAEVDLIERQHELVHRFVRTARGVEVAQSDALPGPDAAALAPWLSAVAEDAVSEPSSIEHVVACAGPGGQRFAAMVETAQGHPSSRAAAVLRMPDETWLPACAAAALATGLRSAPPVAPLPPREKTALHRHPDFMRLAVPAALLLMLVAVATVLSLWRRTAEEDFVRLTQQSQQDSRAQEALEARNREAAVLHKELEAKRADVAALANRVALLDDGMARRVQLIPALLQAMAETIPPTVVLDAFEESKTQGSFLVRAWSIDPTAINTFTALAQAPLRKLGYSVTGTTLSEARGRNGDAGYAASFWLVNDPDALLSEAVAAPRAATVPSATAAGTARPRAPAAPATPAKRARRK